MKIFAITLEETVTYDLIIEAENSDEAGVIASEIWANSMDPTHDFGGCGHGVEVSNSEELDASKVARTDIDNAE